MAGEDPGVSTLAVILELIQRAWSAFTGSIKAVVSGTMDVIKTGMFISWRRKMMQGQQGPDLERGEQSLKDLRAHEQVGAHIVTVEIGDRTAMEALREELRRLELDFAITEHDGQYTLHYKEANEQDVLYAQQAALEKLYGDRDRANDEQETPNDPDQRDEHDRDGDEGREQGERENREGDGQNDREDEQREDRQHDERDEHERSDDSSDQDRSDDERRDEEQRQEQEREAEERQREQQEQEQAEQQTRNQSQTQGQPVPDKVVPAAAVLTGAAAANEHQQAHEQGSTAQNAAQLGAGPERASQMEAPEPQHRQENAADLKPNQRFEPLEDLIKEARERARAKNMARNHPERAMRLDHHRSLTRERARNFEPGH